MILNKRTKIVATIGPSSQDKETIASLVKSGMNVVRLNFSHSDHVWHKGVINAVREVSREMGVPVAIIADLQGPRIRTKVNNDIEIANGEEIIFYEDSETADWGEKKTIGIDHPGVLKCLKMGKMIFVEDGKYRFKVVYEGEKYCTAQSLQDGIIGNHKGMNFPDSNLLLSSLAEKDKNDLMFALKERVEYVALSFVGNRENIEEAKECMRPFVILGEYEPEIIVKIERQEAIDRLEEIVEVTDAVMVARGDLAIETGACRLGVLQKTIVQECLSRIKPVIMATQMLESMMEDMQPTRAEISDVSNAVIDHTDATMLSGETAGGKYPVECVKMMSDIISETENSSFDDLNREIQVSLSVQESKYFHTIEGAYRLAKDNDISAILVVTYSGMTARLVSHFRPKAPIFVAAFREDVYQKMALLWGVESYRTGDAFEGNGERDEEEDICQFEEMLAQKGILKKGDRFMRIYRSSGEENKRVELREREK